MNIIQTLKNARKGRFSLILAIGYEIIVAIELVIERILDGLFCRPCITRELDDLTAMIKTFERPKKLKNLIKSIRRLYPNLKIIVVDDSKDPSEIHGVKRIVLPYDSGVSAGRNAGLKVVKTPYMLCLDDDFVFNRNTNLLKALHDIKNIPSIDILAGEVIYLPLRIAHDYSQTPVFFTPEKPLYEPGTLLGGYPVHLKVPNFYIARTDKVKLVSWDDNLKRMDHADFFTRAVGILTSVQDRDFKVLHYPTYFNKMYMERKNDNFHDRIVLQHKYQGHDA